MSVKIRLQRFGRKKSAFFHIVVADSRAPRDGKIIEKIGTYNPITNPAIIELNAAKAFEWLKKGAQPTDTTKALLSYKGVMHHYHLHRGVLKGALTEEQMEAKFAAWMEQKAAQVENKKTGLSDAKSKLAQERFDRETKISEERAKKIAAKNAPPVVEEVAPEETNVEATTDAEVTATDDAAPAAEETTQNPE